MEAAGRGRCVADACGTGCAAGLVCAVSVDRFVRLEEAGPPSPPSDGPTQLGCFPAQATSFARPYGMRSPCDRQGSDRCALETGRWVCERPISTRPCGRPLVVDGVAVVARVGQSPGWRDSGRDRSNFARSTFAARVRHIAFEEHASIAAFARTIAMLSALGAPADLLAETSRALSDEIVHAREAFTLARRLGAADLDPGVFPEAVAAFPPPDRVAEELLADVIIGGCVGESLAVVEAQALREEAPPEAHAFFDRVIADETRHAELAFTTARWLLRTSPRLETVAADALDRAMARFGVEQDSPWPTLVARLAERNGAQAGTGQDVAALAHG